MYINTLELKFIEEIIIETLSEKTKRKKRLGKILCFACFVSGFSSLIVMIRWFFLNWFDRLIPFRLPYFLDERFSDSELWIEGEVNFSICLSRSEFEALRKGPKMSYELLRYELERSECTYYYKEHHIYLCIFGDKCRRRTAFEFGGNALSKEKETT